MIDDFVCNDSMRWPLFFHQTSFDLSNADPDSLTTIEFLYKKLSFGFAAPFSGQYEPTANWIDGRTALPKDLSNDDLRVVKDLVFETHNCFVLAKCYDVLYDRYGKEDYCEKAAEAFEEIVDYLSSIGKGKLSCDFLRRAFFLRKSLKQRGEIGRLLSKYVVRSDRPCEERVRFFNAFFADHDEFVEKRTLEDKGLRQFLSMTEIPISDVGLAFAQNVVRYYSSRHDESTANAWRNKYADVCEQLGAQSPPVAWRFLGFAIDALLVNEEANQERINDLQFKKEASEKEFCRTLNLVPVSIHPETEALVRQKVDQAVLRIANCPTTAGKFAAFLQAFQPVTADEIESFCKRAEEGIFSQLVSTVVVDERERVIAELKPGDKESRKRFNSVQAYRLFHSAYYYRVAMGFLREISGNEEVPEIVHQIIERNEIVPFERVGIVEQNLVLGLSGNIRLAVFGLSAQFEEGCRFFLKEKRHIFPRKKKGSRPTEIDINDMLIKPRFRDPIAELLGADLVNELRFLLVEPLYGNLRNQNYHSGYAQGDAIAVIELMAFFRLFQAYCMGCDANADH